MKFEDLQLALKVATHLVQVAGERGYEVKVNHNSNGHEVKRDTMRETLLACLDGGVRLFVYTRKPGGLAVDRYFTVLVLHWHDDVAVLAEGFDCNEAVDAIDDFMGIARNMVREARPLPDNVIAIKTRRQSVN